MTLTFSSSDPYVAYYDHVVQDGAGNDNGRLDPGETTDLVVFLKNFGAPATGVECMLESSDPFVIIHNGLGVYGNMPTGTIASNGMTPFSIEAAPYTPHGHAVPLTLRATYDGGQTVSHVRLIVGKHNFLVWDPSPDKSSGPVLYSAIRSLGYNGAYTQDLPATELDGYQCLFVSLGIYAQNYVIPSNSAEALAIVDFIQAGGSAYMEGGDCWYYDPLYGGHSFNSLFGLYGTADGTGDMNHAVGVGGTFTEGMDFDYTGENSYIDHLAPTGTGFVVFNNSSPTYACAVANDAGAYRTIGCSFEFAGLADGPSPSTQAELAQAIMNFLLPPDPQSIGGDRWAAHLDFLAPASPNPCMDQTILRYGLARSGPVRIALYDVAGRCERVLVDAPQSAGAHILRLDTRRLEAGVYFVQSRFGDVSLSRKCIVSR